MNDAESRFARKVIGHLDQGAADLRSGTLYRLQQARSRALAGVERVPVANTQLAFAGGGPERSRPRLRLTPTRWLGAVLVLGALAFGYQQWHAMQQVREFEELDLHLLASDLPIDAYLDRGFQNWLRTTFDY
jgi:Protein of unknown function (DUF3619)